MLAASGTEDDPSRRQCRKCHGRNSDGGRGLFLCDVQIGCASDDPYFSQNSRGHITVNALAPGPFQSGMTKFAIGDDTGSDRGENVFQQKGSVARKTSLPVCCFAGMAGPMSQALLFLFLAGSMSPPEPPFSERSDDENALSQRV